MEVADFIQFCLDVLQPVSEEFTEKQYFDSQIGFRMDKHTSVAFPELQPEGIALVFLPPKDKELSGKEHFRSHFYELFLGNWHMKMFDLGDLPSSSPENTIFAIKEIGAYLLTQKITLLVVGGTREITYALYKSFENQEHMVNVACADAFLDFGDSHQLISEENYLSRMVSEQPSYLQNFTNLGYQIYYNAQEMLHFTHQMHFDCYRLGEITQQMHILEPLLRNQDVITLNMSSIQATDLQVVQGLVNGFSAREICALSRYAGLGMRSSAFGIYNIPQTFSALQLCSQVLWYFIEGLHNRIMEFPTPNDENHFEIYKVEVEPYELIFYRSKLTGRWWIAPSQEVKGGVELLPCSQSEYEQALLGIIPERWWSLYKK